MKRPALLLKNISFFLFCAPALVCGLRQISCSDIWLHIKTGSWIWKYNSVPRSQLYSFILGDRQWIDHEWLFQVIVYPLYRLAGANGLILLRLLVISCIMLIFFSVAKKTGRFFLISAAAALISLIASSYRWHVRPELFSLLFLTAFIYMLKNYNGKDSIFLLLPLELLWVNMHGYFIMGPVILSIFIIVRLAQAKVKLPFEWNSSRLGRPELRKLVYLLLMMAAVLLLNPYLLKGALYPFGIFLSALKGSFGPSYSFGSVFELGSIPIMHIIYKPSLSLISICIMLFFVSLVLNLRRADIFDLAVFILFVCLAVTANRHIGMLALSAGILTLFNLYTAAEKGSFMQTERMTYAAKGLVAAVSIIIAAVLSYNLFDIARAGLYILKGRYIYDLDCNTKPFLTGKNRLSFNQPFGAAAFIRRNGIEANIFNFFNQGAYLIFSLYPDCRVFIDGRTEVYGDMLLSAWDRIRRQPKLIAGIKGKLGIDCIVLPCTGDFAASFFRYLYSDSYWQLVFFDAKSCVFLADKSRFKAIIRKNRVKLDDFNINPNPVMTQQAKEKSIYPEIFVLLAKFFYETGMYASGLSAIDTAESILSDDYTICNLKAGLLFRLGRQKESIGYFNKAVRLAPENPEIYRNIGVFYTQAGRIDIARKYFEEGLRIDPDNIKLKDSLESLAD